MYLYLRRQIWSPITLQLASFEPIRFQMRRIWFLKIHILSPDGIFLSILRQSGLQRSNLSFINDTFKVNFKL